MGAHAQQSLKIIKYVFKPVLKAVFHRKRCYSAFLVPKGTNSNLGIQLSIPGIHWNFEYTVRVKSYTLWEITWQKTWKQPMTPKFSLRFQLHIAEIKMKMLNNNKSEHISWNKLQHLCTAHRARGDTSESAVALHKASPLWN